MKTMFGELSGHGISPKTGIELIADERREQIEKHGWSKEHDADVHQDGSLSKVAALLAHDGVKYIQDVPEWGYSLRHKLKDDRIHRLKVAGALIAAEIDRLSSLEKEVKKP